MGTSGADTLPPGDWRRSLPNYLTVARLVLAVAFFAVLTPWRYEASPVHVPGAGVGEGGTGGAGGRGGDWWLIASAAIFILAAATDALDGHLARKWNVVSVFGRIMDPFADKLLVIGAFAFLAGPGFWLPDPAGGGRQVSAVLPWMVALILGRELLVTSIRGVMEGQGISFAATASGKWKMILQSVAVPGVLVLLALGAGETRAGALTIAVLVWATVVVTVWSGLPYVARAMAAVRQRGPQGAGG